MPVNFERKERSESHDSKNLRGERKIQCLIFQMHEKCEFSKCVGGGGGGLNL